MRIQVLSDLHFEALAELDELPGFKEHNFVRINPEADVIVLAGDNANGGMSLHFASQTAQYAGRPVIWLPGNHEYYGQYFGELSEKFLHATEAGVHILMNRQVIIDDVRFLGGTLWTDFKLRTGHPRVSNKLEAMLEASLGLTDFFAIRRAGSWPRFTPDDSLEEHNRTRAFLQAALDEPFAGKTVVVTHHAPHVQSINPRFAGDPLNPCFASDLSPLLRKADLWLHGHVHDSVDYRIGRCRVVANPRGYPRSKNGDLRFENKAFDPLLMIDI